MNNWEDLGEKMVDNSFPPVIQICRQKVKVPSYCDGHIVGMSFAERQLLPRLKREQVAAEHDREMKKLREFRAEPAPGSHSSLHG